MLYGKVLLSHYLDKFDATFEDKCELKNAAVRITYKAESPMLE